MDISTEETSTDAKCKKKKYQHNNTIFPEKRGHKGKKNEGKKRDKILKQPEQHNLLRWGYLPTESFLIHDWVSRLKNKSLKKGKEKQERESKKYKQNLHFTPLFHIFSPRPNAAPYQMTQRQVE